MIYKQYDIVVVPFPFTDQSANKRRPALIVSNHAGFGNIIDHSVCAMITSTKNSEWPMDTTINGLASAGLSAPSCVRMKFFTLDHRLIIRKLGRLGVEDLDNFQQNLQAVLL